MRKISALIVAAAVVASLAACTSQDVTAASCTTGQNSGDSSSLVTATGTLGAEPVVDFPTPLVTDGIEVSTLETGDGRVLTDGNLADFQVTVLNAKTGAAVVSSGYDDAAPLRRQVGNDTEFGPILDCVAVGSRIAATTTVEQLFGAADLQSQYDLGPKDSIVLIVDVADGFADKATGTDQLPVAGMPSVVTAPDGTPGVTIVDETAPEVLTVATTKKGDGAVVKANDLAVLHFTAIDYDTQTKIQSTWDDGAIPPTVQVKDYDATDGTGLNPGVAKALVGKTVGSQIVVVVPADAGYPAGASPEGFTEGSTVIYVVDILKSASAK